MTVEDLEGNIINPSRTITLESNGDYLAAIPHNTKLIFKNVPEGTTYTINDNDGSRGYEVWSKDFDFEHDYFPILSASSMPVGYSEQALRMGVMGSKDAGYLYINTLQGNVPTGIKLQSKMPILVSVVIIGWLVYTRRKSRKEDCAAA